MKYALVNNGLVVRIIDNETPHSEDPRFVACDDSVSSGFTWDGEQFIPPSADVIRSVRTSQLKHELAALDITRIRPTAEGDTAYLAILNAQAVALRAELQGLL